MSSSSNRLRLALFLLLSEKVALLRQELLDVCKANRVRHRRVALYGFENDPDAVLVLLPLHTEALQEQSCVTVVDPIVEVLVQLSEQSVQVDLEVAPQRVDELKVVHLHCG